MHQRRGLKHVVLSLSAIVTLCGTASAEASVDLESTAAKAAAAIERLHYNASKALVTAAQDKTFGAYFHTHDHEGREEVKGRIDNVSLAVQERFHVEEMCLIDPEGKEISRIVGKEIAHDLAIDEADAPFFEPGFSTPHRKVHISPIYMSPDAEKWVVAYVTPVILDGEKKSILHYEHSLTAYTLPLEHQSRATGANIMLMTESGHVIYDSTREIAIELEENFENLDDYFSELQLFDIEYFKAVNSGGFGEIAGPNGPIEVAIRDVGDWIVVAWSDI
ncbi:PDC sensor domain-containing protein [uncultured Jannaschia sp.]|uniref:PDC sensor domain-containing protein n=1 Tax=uncultured Jannaschia sp. TaxID=293347 RepID=UPI002625B2ED|nr:PDC sensor domain-containing protein [uncultured Jannaschia sp.]